MPLESATTINQLDPSNPAGTDDTSRGDDHIRLIKSTLRATFANITGIVTATASDLNQVAALVAELPNLLKTDGSRPATGDLDLGGNKVANLAPGTAGTDAVNLTQLNDAVATLTAAIESSRQSQYPVGFRIIIGNTDANPSTLLGYGTWALVAQDRVLMGAGSTYSRGQTGGSAQVTLTEQNMPSHSHLTVAEQQVGDVPPVSSSIRIASGRGTGGSSFNYGMRGSNFPATVGKSSETGDGTPFTTLPPYEAVNIWQRTA